MLGNDSRVNIYVEEITENRRTFVQSVLEICSSEEMDSGEYTCSAESRVGNDSASFNLTVFPTAGEFNTYFCEMYMYLSTAVVCSHAFTYLIFSTRTSCDCDSTSKSN